MQKRKNKKMSDKEKEISEVLSKTRLFTLLGIQSVNHKPHPYAIGSKHVVFASDYSGGMLSEESIKEGERQGKVKCEQPKCSALYSEHTFDTVGFLQLTRNCTNDEATLALKEIVDLIDKFKIDGVTLVETKEKFKIT